MTAISRRQFLAAVALLAASVSCACALAAAVPADALRGANLAVVATASTSFVSGHETITALNDGFTPANSNDKSRGAYGNWPQSGTQWVQYEWNRPIKANGVDVYWFDDQRGVRLPKACRLKYWDGSSFVPVPGITGLGLAANKFNASTFAEITTTRLRLEMDGQEKFSTGILEWRVYDSGGSANFAPSVSAGVDRVVVLPGQTYLDAVVRDDGKPKAAPAVRWSKDSGPGAVAFGDAAVAATTARFSAPGDYVLRLTADDGQLSSSATVAVTVDPPPPAAHLEPVETTAYTLTSPLWRSRAKALIVNWIPHCVRKIEDPETREGGIENFVQAGLK